MEEEFEDDIVEVLRELREAMRTLGGRVRFLESYLKDEGFGLEPEDVADLDD